MTTEFVNLDINKNKLEVTKIKPTNLTEIEIIETPYTVNEEATSDVALTKDTVLEEEEEEEYTREENENYNKALKIITALKEVINKIDAIAMQEASKLGKEWDKLNRESRNIIREKLLATNNPLMDNIKNLVTMAKTIDLTDVFGDVGYNQFINDEVPIVRKYLYIRDASV